MLLRFCSSSLWLRQALEPAGFPLAINERDFVIPGEGMLCHDQRRNLSDQQETAQWLGGQQVPKSIISALLSSLVQNCFAVLSEAVSSQTMAVS